MTWTVTSGFSGNLYSAEGKFLDNANFIVQTTSMGASPYVENLLLLDTSGDAPQWQSKLSCILCLLSA